MVFLLYLYVWQYRIFLKRVLDLYSMKKIIVVLPILVALTLTSCKRTYVCECTQYNTTNGQFVKINVSEESLGKLSNQDAESVSPQCESKSFDDDNNNKETRCQLKRK